MLLCSLFLNALCLKALAMRKSQKFFAVRNGRRTGVFYSHWDEVQPLVHGYPRAVYKSFKTETEAIAFLNFDDEVRRGPTLPLIGRKRKSDTDTNSGLVVGSLTTQSQAASEAHSGVLEGDSRRNGISPSSSSSSSSGEDKPSIVIHADTLLIYTDGCCIGNRNVKEVVQPAGWGFVVISGGDGSSDETAVSMDERCGPIVLDASSPEYLGATVTSNNTAELTAIGQALKYVLDKYASAAEFPHVVIRYDSEYAAKSVLGIWNGKHHRFHRCVDLLNAIGEKNAELIQRIRELLSEVRRLDSARPLEFLKVKGHSNNKWNDRADELAELGAKQLEI